MATELGPTPVKKPASGGVEPHHAPKGVGEDNAIASQGVQGWGLHVGRAVAAEVIGAEGVDGDKYHVRGRTPGRDGGRQPG